MTIPQSKARRADPAALRHKPSRHDDPIFQAKARVFDFRRPNKLNRDHIRSLENIHETFARQLTTVLSSTLRAVSQVTVASIEQMAYEDYVEEVPNPSHMTIISLDPLPGVAVLQFPLSAAMVIIDLMLGGHGASGGLQRPLTDIERGLMRTIIDRALAELTYSFESVAQIEPAILGYESNPQFVQVAGPSDMTVVVTLEMKVGREDNKATLCFTYSALQPILDTIASVSSHGQPGRNDIALARAQLSERMLEVPVDVAIEFAPTKLTSAAIVELEVGDVIALGHPTSKELTATVGGTPTFQVRAARAGKRLACQIVENVEPKPRLGS